MESTSDEAKYAANNNSLFSGKKVLSFPLGLGADIIDKESGRPNQFMMFKINTDETGSTLYEDVKTGAVLVAQQANTNSTGVGIGEANVFQKTGSAGYAENVSKFGAEAASKEKWLVKTGLTSIDRAIILPMPDNHNVSAVIDYVEDSPSELTKMGDFFNNGVSGVTDQLKKAMYDAAGGDGNNPGIINRLKSALVGGGSITNPTKLMQASRLAVNPKMEVMFKSIGFRQFSFMFSFAPKTPMESAVVKEIITSFRYYALPEISEGKLFYIFPAEFEISFIRGDKDNPAIPRIATSVLQSIAVNYSPMGDSWASLPDGMPVITTMTLNFKEIELIDRNRVWSKDHPILSGY